MQAGHKAPPPSLALFLWLPTLFISGEDDKRVAVVEDLGLPGRGVQELERPIGQVLLIDGVVGVEVNRGLAGSAGLWVVHPPLGTFYTTEDTTSLT